MDEQVERRGGAARAMLRLPLGAEAWGVEGPALRPGWREVEPSAWRGWLGAKVRTLLRRRRPVRTAEAPSGGLSPAR